MNALAAVAAAAGLLAVLAARRLGGALRTLRADLARPPVATLSLAAEHEVALPEAGDFVLYAEAPLGSTAFAGLGWDVVDAATGMPVPGRPVVVRAHRTGFQRTRLALHRFRVERAGTVRLRTTGLVAGRDHGDARLLVVRAPAALALAEVPLDALVLIACFAVAIGAGTMASRGLDLDGAWRLVREATREGRRPPAPHDEEAAGEPPPGVPARGRSPRAGGRTLRAERAAARGWRAVAWTAQRMTVEVPEGWRLRRDGDELEIRAESPPAFLVAHVSPTLSGVSAGQLLAIQRTSAAEQLADGRIDGWAERRLGALAGVTTIERRGDDERMVVWNGVRATPRGAVTVTLVLGAGGARFDRVEPVLGAILDSVRFEEPPSAAAQPRGSP